MKKTLIIISSLLLLSCDDSDVDEQNQSSTSDFTITEKIDISAISKLTSFDSLNKFLVENYDTLAAYYFKDQDTTILRGYPVWSCDSVSIQTKNCLAFRKQDGDYKSPKIPDKFVSKFESSIRQIDTNLFFSFSICQNRQIQYFFKEIERTDSVLIVHCLVHNRQTKKECLYQNNRDSIINNKFTYRILQTFNYKAAMRKMQDNNNPH